MVQPSHTPTVSSMPWVLSLSEWNNSFSFWCSLETMLFCSSKKSSYFFNFSLSIVKLYVCCLLWSLISLNIDFHSFYDELWSFVSWRSNSDCCFRCASIHFFKCYIVTYININLLRYCQLAILQSSLRQAFQVMPLNCL